MKITKEMLDLATHIVETKSGRFDPTRFDDHYENALQELLQKKKNGLPIKKKAAPSNGNVINLMDALKASLRPTNGKSDATEKPVTKSKRKAG